MYIYFLFVLPLDLFDACFSIHIKIMDINFVLKTIKHVKSQLKK